MTDELITRAASDIVKAKKVVALTGAGMSVESGIAPFRGEGGIWEKYDPVEYAYIDVLRTNPGKTWILLSEMQKEILKAKPNPGHRSLAELERLGFLSSIITQNVDGLHHEAGSKQVIEFHGNHRRANCMTCGKQMKSEDISLETLPPRCDCGGVIRPDVVFFGEAIPYDALTTSRPYRKAYPQTAAIHYILKMSGKHFDPDLVPVFIETIVKRGNVNGKPSR